jgi:asparagine synthase (glutamine-hydrolysing)
MGTAVQRTVYGAEAVALSGGIDSPAVAAFAAQRHLDLAARPLQAYTYVYPRQSTVDESPYTRAVAEQLGINLAEFEVSTGPLDELDKWVVLADGPWDSLPMATAAYGYRVAAGMGATQVLTGTLAEYVFTVDSFLLGHLASHGRWRALADQMSQRRALGLGRRRLLRSLVWELTPAPLGKLKARAVRRKSNFFPAWTDMTVVGGYRYETALLDPVRKRWIAPTLQAAHGTTTTSEALEICAASEGVTVRQPLADRDLWEWFLRLPAEVKFPDTTPKSIVRKALRGRVPDVVLDRRDKTVFDEHVMDTVPWDRVQHYLGDTEYRMPGIDYPLLLDRIERKEFRPVELIWAYDLCGVHAFLKSFQ